MDNQYMVAENIVELIFNNGAQCSDKEEVLDEIRRVLGQIKSHKFEQLYQELGLF